MLPRRESSGPPRLSSTVNHSGRRWAMKLHDSLRPVSRSMAEREECTSAGNPGRTYADIHAERERAFQLHYLVLHSRACAARRRRRRRDTCRSCGCWADRGILVPGPTCCICGTAGRTRKIKHDKATHRHAPAHEMGKSCWETAVAPGDCRPRSANSSGSSRCHTRCRPLSARCRLTRPSRLPIASSPSLSLNPPLIAQLSLPHHRIPAVFLLYSCCLGSGATTSCPDLRGGRSARPCAGKLRWA